MHVVAVLVVSSIACSAVVLGAVVLSALLAKGEDNGQIVIGCAGNLPDSTGGQHSNRAQHKDALRGGGHGRGRGAGATDNGGSDGDAGELAGVAGLAFDESQ